MSIPSEVETEYRNYLQSIGMPFLVDDMIAGLLEKRPKGEDVTKYLLNFLKTGESDRFVKALLESRQAGKPQKAYINRDLREMGGGQINWRKVAEKLPVGRSPEDKKKREEIWKGIDINGNNYVSLAELDKGMRDILQLGEVFATKPVMLRAFMRAKNVNKNSRARLGEDFCTKSEFRALLVFLRRYFELFILFDAIDEDNDRRLSEEEFAKCTQSLQKWGLKIAFPQAQFKQLEKQFRAIDKNAGGFILFDEFCEWAIANRLDLDNGEEVDDYSDELWQGTEHYTETPSDEPEAPPAAGSGHHSGGVSAHSGRGGGVGQPTGRGGRGGGRAKSAAPGGPVKSAFVRAIGEVDWEKISKQLPAGRTAAEEIKRTELFNLCDVNGNHYLSLAEVDKGLRDVFQLPDMFSCKPASLRAFQAAKAANPKTRARLGQDFVTRSEFRVLLEDLKRYFELFLMFDTIDADDDGRLTLEEFRANVPKLECWGIKAKDFNLDAEFKSMVRSGGSRILFGEFCQWAIEKKLHMEGDPDPL